MYTERFQTMHHEREALLKLNFLKVVELNRPWDNVLILIYLINVHDLKNENMCM